MKLNSAAGIVWLSVLALGSGACERLGAESGGEDHGQAHVEKTCVGCHPGAQLDAVVARRIAAHGADSLDAFLAGHHVADAALRGDVVSYLQARAAAADSAR